LIDIPLEWKKVIRRLLIANIIIILDTKIAVSMGFSHCDPLFTILCRLMMEYFQYISEYPRQIDLFCILQRQFYLCPFD